MKRRHVLIALIAFAVLVTAALTTSMILSKSPINETNFRRLRIGMSETEVADIFGLPPGMNVSGPITVQHDGAQAIGMDPEFVIYTHRTTHLLGAKTWTSDIAQVTVYFNEGKMTAAQLQPVRRRPESVLAKVRRWLGQ